MLTRFGRQRKIAEDGIADHQKRAEAREIGGQEIETIQPFGGAEIDPGAVCFLAEKISKNAHGGDAELKADETKQRKSAANTAAPGLEMDFRPWAFRFG
jgi:hypothetical protein